MNENWTITPSGLIVLNRVLISDGEQNWASRLDLSSEAQEILSPPHFQATTGVEYRLGILPGYLFPGRRRTQGNIRTFADECILSGWKLHVPHLEVAGLAREAITEDETRAIEQDQLMYFAVPLGGGCYSDVLVMMLWGGQSRCLRAWSIRPEFRYDRNDGFVFCLSRVGFQN